MQEKVFTNRNFADNAPESGLIRKALPKTLKVINIILKEYARLIWRYLWITENTE